MKTSTITRTDHVTAPQGNGKSLEGHEIQAYGHSRRHPIALDEGTCNASIDSLNQLLADVITLRDMYKKHHWQISGPMFYPLHLLFDKHSGELHELVDVIAKRVQTLGGVCLAMAADVAEATLIPRVPKGREDADTQIARLLHGHEIILEEARAMARATSKSGDDGTNDLIVSDIIRTNETQVWFIFEHVIQPA